MIFDQISQSDFSAKLGSEGEFAFLNRSSRSEIETVRRMLEQLALEYPQSELPELISRIQSGNDTHFNSAVFELLLYSTLKKLGYSLQPHPALNNGSTKRPDFLVTSPNGSQFYLEAVSASEENGTLVGKNKMIQSTLDALKLARHDKFRVAVNYSGLPATQPRTRKLISDVHKWLESLDPDTLISESTPGRKRGASDFFWQHENWKLHLRPLAIRSENRGKSKSLIGSTNKGFFIVNSVKPLRKAVTSKGNRYGDLDRPCLIAVNFNTSFLDVEDEEQALFGTEAIMYTVDDSASESQTMERLSDGAWIGKGGPKYTRVSGVWIFNDLNPYSIVRRRSTLYFNPWAARSLPEELKRLPHAELKDGSLTRHDGISLGEIFDLQLSWPEE